MNSKEPTLVMVFLILLAPSADQQGPLWPPLSSACHWSPAQRWSRGPPHTIPSRFPSAPLTLQHPARWPGSCPPSVHCGCTPGWVLPPHHEELRKDNQRVQFGQLSDFSFLRILYINLYIVFILPFDIPLIAHVFPALSRPTTRMVTFL